MSAKFMEQDNVIPSFAEKLMLETSFNFRILQLSCISSLVIINDEGKHIKIQNSLLINKYKIVTYKKICDKPPSPLHRFFL